MAHELLDVSDSRRAEVVLLAEYQFPTQRRCGDFEKALLWWRKGFMRVL